jgi:hypothetical protein
MHGYACPCCGSLIALEDTKITMRECPTCEASVYTQKRIKDKADMTAKLEGNK